MAVLWPRRFCRTVMFAPALMASDAHVCLSSCGVMTGNSGVTASPVALISSWRRQIADL